MLPPPLKSRVDARAPSDESPHALPSFNVPTYKLFKIAGIGWATFCGGPLAGGVLLALNSRRLGHQNLARQQLFFSALATLAMGVVTFLATAFWGRAGDAGFRGMAIGALAATIAYARHAQGLSISVHRTVGATFVSNWKALGIGILVLLGEFALVTAVLMILLLTGLFNPFP
jgi:hypothetical protein